MIRWSTLNTQQQARMLARPAMADSAKLSRSVSDILARVRQQGDAAIKSLTAQFDGAELTALRLPSDQLENAVELITPAVKSAIDLAYQNIKAFHQAQQLSPVTVETSPGVICEQHIAPIEAVGLYIPGGSAPLPSTVLMLGTTAQVAGCKRKVLCTPPGPDGNIAAEIRYAAKLTGIDEVYLCGGAQAIAGMAFGTESISKVDKIYGPGNSFVTEAKQQVSQDPQGAAIDMPAGPSEVLVLADSNANPVFVAADLLSQAEHGPDSQAILVSDNEALITATQAEVERQLGLLPRQEIAAEAMSHSRYFLADNLDEAIAISNQYAPEHLIVQVENARDCLPKLKNAGSIFLGKWSPESAGDYASGTNHVLPTYGYAKTYSSLGLADFTRRYTVQELSYEGLNAIGNAIMDLAAAEGLDAHKNAVALRLEGEQ